ncbi:MAG: metallophosphoesterase [Eubacterium sp.]|nr:metallophosphoesterase [Eubacterium sp.]
MMARFWAVVALGIFFIILLVLTAFVFIKYFQLWRRLGWNKVIYWVIHGVFFVNFIGGVAGYFGYDNDFIKNILLRIAGIYMVVFTYSLIFLGIRQLIIAIGTRIEADNKIYKFIKSTRKGITCILVFTIICGVLSVINMRWYQVTEYKVSINKHLDVDDTGKSENKDSMRIAMISDVHMGSGVLGSDITRVVDKINETKPDIVVLDGDFVDQSTTESQIELMIQALKKINAPYGVFYVEGNHEVYLSKDVTHYFRNAGITVLMDQITTLANGVQIVGRKDFSDISIENDVAKLFEGVDKTKPVVVLSHQPHQFLEVSKAGGDLVMSGHTHGGQLFGNFLTYLANDMNYGMKKYGDTYAITSSGIGGWGVPVKLGVPSEVVVIDMKFSK